MKVGDDYFPRSLEISFGILIWNWARRASSCTLFPCDLESKIVTWLICEEEKNTSWTALSAQHAPSERVHSCFFLCSLFSLHSSLLFSSPLVFVSLLVAKLWIVDTAFFPYWSIIIIIIVKVYKNFLLYLKMHLKLMFQQFFAPLKTWEWSFFYTTSSFLSFKQYFRENKEKFHNGSCLDTFSSTNQIALVRC